MYIYMYTQLDMGTSDRICLMSRDEKSILVVSYKDLKKCLQNAFNELITPVRARR